MNYAAVLDALVVAAPDDFALVNQDGADGNPALRESLLRLFNGSRNCFRIVALGDNLRGRFAGLHRQYHQWNGTVYSRVEWMHQRDDS